MPIRDKFFLKRLRNLASLVARDRCGTVTLPDERAVIGSITRENMDPAKAFTIINQCTIRLRPAPVIR